MGKIINKKIIIEGRVQGVGFRPFIFRLAEKYKISGNVSNINGCVIIKASAEKSAYDAFFAAIMAEKPLNAVIEKIEIEEFEAKSRLNKFIIAESGNNKEDSNIFISPDLSICEDCIAEIYNVNNRRFFYSFNSCVNCGVRYSAITQTPYDRANTSMDKFELCEKCRDEYKNSMDRRFHAETVCCDQCGPVLKYNEFHGYKALEKAVEDLKKFKIIAIKGIGGYHFACSPYSGEAVRALREIKGRDKKPFAVMFRDCEEVEKICFISPQEKKELTSKEKPIVLLDLANINNNTFADETLCGDNRCGCFLPYTPLHALIMREISTLVMTSANISGSAIIYKDDEMQKAVRENIYSKEIKAFGGILSNNREITRSVEDSVVQANKGIQVLRRSRGYVPAPFKIRSKQAFIAFGGDLKAAFLLAKNGYAYPSQYFGDLEEKSVYERFADSIYDMQNLFDITPEFAICDTHPNYFSARYAQEYAESSGIPLYTIQHHHAHAASVIAEHKVSEKAIGVIFDGTGYGADGKIWGAEFMLCNGGEYRRMGHMDYTKLIGGDNIARNADKTALCYLIKHGLDSIYTNPDNKIIKLALEKNINCVEYSSMGRFFDAVSAVLGICGKNDYEGECAVALQREAEKAKETVKMRFDINADTKENKFIFDCGKILEIIINTKKNKEKIQKLALGFHIAVAELINDMCIMIRNQERNKADVVVLSGGVFQNRLLTFYAKQMLEYSKFRVYTNRKVAPNDNGLALGQAYLAEYIKI